MSPLWNLNDPPSGDDIAAALQAFPVVADVLRAAAKPPDRVLPFHHVCGFDELFPCLSPLGLRLLQLDRFHGGVSRDAALQETSEVPPELVDREASNLVIAGLAVFRGDRLRSHPDIARYIPMPLPMLENAVNSINSDRLATACRRMGIRSGTTKAERSEAVLAGLRQPTTIEKALSSVSPEARRLFGRIVELTSVDRFGFTDSDEAPGSVPLDSLMNANTVQYRAASRDLLSLYAPVRGNMTPLGELVEALLITASMGWGDSVTLFMEVAHGCGKALGPALVPPPDVVGVPVQETPMGPTRVVAQLGDVVGHLGDHPVEGKKSGDRRAPVATWRSAAKATGIDKDLGVLLGGLAADLGLNYAQAMPARGLVRKGSHPVRGLPNLRRVAEFDRLEAGTRWLSLIEAWLEGGRGEDAYAQSVKRSLLVSVLASMPEGRAIERGDFMALATGRHVALNDVDELSEHLTTAAALGLIGDPGRPGLTEAGRAAIGGADAVNAVVGGGDRSFLVQPDHSVVAPPNMAPDVVAQLMRYADLESEGGASVWRLSARRLAQAAPTTSPEEVQRFFADGSSVPVPDAVLRFIDDAMGSVSPVTVTEVGCVITAADPMVISDAARHKPAKLTVVAAGVATSPLTAARVRDVLATRGVILASSTPAEATITSIGSAASADPSAPSTASPTGTDALLPPPVDDAIAGWIVDQPDPADPLPSPKPIGFDDHLVAALTASISQRAST